MGLPKKALRFEKLIFKNKSGASSQINSLTDTNTPNSNPNLSHSKPNASSHEVKEVSFLDYDGKIKKGFFKKLDGNYKPSLIYFSVLTGGLLRQFLHDLAAEDRPVYDENNNLVGSVSIKLDGYVHISEVEKKISGNPKNNNWPSLKTLLETNVMQILFFCWSFFNNDVHPDNLPFCKSNKDKHIKAGIFDYDMFLYPITEIIKGERYIGGTANGKIELKVTDFSDFPCLSKDSQQYTYWPSRPPLNKNPNPYKLFYNPQEFEALAKNPTIILQKRKKDSHDNELDSQEKISAQEQLYTAALKALIFYQPDQLNIILKDYVGDELLAYTSLEKSKKKKLEEKFKNFFNETSDLKPFFETFSKIIHEHYDEMYRTVVFYPGCEENCAKFSRPSFSQFLYKNPLVYDKLLKEAQFYNAQIESVQKEYYKNCKDHPNKSFETACISPTNEIISNDYSAKRCFNLAELEERYHQVWRDSHISYIIYFLSGFEKLIKQTKDSLRLIETDKEHEEKVTALAKNPKDPNIREAWQLVPEEHAYKLNTTQINKELDCHNDNKIKKALFILINLKNKFYEVSKTYYKKERHELSRQSNDEFRKSLKDIAGMMDIKVLKQLGNNATSLGKTAKKLEESLLKFSEYFWFHAQLTAKENRDSCDLYIHKDIELASHTEKETVDKCLNLLFIWAKELTSEALAQKIKDIIENKYNKGVVNNRFFKTTRHRGPDVLQFLEESKDIPGDYRLAYILSSRNKEGSGALNKLLIKHLIPEMLKETHGNIDYAQFNLFSVRKAIYQKKFKVDLYTKKAIDFAKTHYQLNTQSINELIYDWISNEKNKVHFKPLIRKCLSEYEALKGYTKIIKGSRKEEIKGYLSNTSNSKILASVFSKKDGGWNQNSFNTILFQAILKDIVDRGDSFLNKNNPNNKPLNLITPEMYKNVKWLYESKILQKEISESMKEYAQSMLDNNINTDFINRDIYLWVNQKDKSKFKALTLQTLETYKKKISFLTFDRSEEVKDYFSSSTSSGWILASIFANRNWNKTSFNTLLFNAILDDIINSGKNRFQEKNYIQLLKVKNDTSCYRIVLGSQKAFAESLKELGEEFFTQRKALTSTR